jgi:integrase
MIDFMATAPKLGEWKARAAVALKFFAGLRPGEARGICWQHCDKFTTDPKTLDAASPVPVIETLANILSNLRERDGNSSAGPILRGPSGKPMILDNLSRRVIIPALKRYAICSQQESDYDADHEFKLDESIPKWTGWYSLRRGVATTLAGLTKDGMGSKGLLRHTNLATTTRHYAKDVPENTQSAMNLLETLFNECSTAGTARPN